MPNNKNTSWKDNFLTWVFSLILLLGLSVFSGYIGKSTTRFRQPVQTAWQYTNYHKTATRSISYRKAAAVLYLPNAIINDREYHVSLLGYNKCIRVKLITACMRFHLTKTTHRFARVKIIPGNSEELPFSITG